MSSYERPDHAAIGELEPLVHRLAEEVRVLRKRCERAEAELLEATSKGGTLAGPELLGVRQRIADLESENQDLRRRMARAREQLKALSSRLVFLEHRGSGAA